MKFVTNLSAERFNTFAASHQKNHFLQSYEWVKVISKQKLFLKFNLYLSRKLL